MNKKPTFNRKKEIVILRYPKVVTTLGYRNILNSKVVTTLGYCNI